MNPFLALGIFMRHHPGAQVALWVDDDGDDASVQISIEGRDPYAAVGSNVDDALSKALAQAMERE